MFEEIEKELDGCCSRCKKECEKWECPIYRIKGIITSEADVSDIDIDDFFEIQDERQMSLEDMFGGGDW